MVSHPQDQHRNLLLQRMAAEDYASLEPHMQRFDARQGLIVFHPGEPVDRAVFVEDGVLSVVAISPEGQRVEAGLIGRDGFGPTILTTGDDRPPYEGSIQISGYGYSLATEPLRLAMEASSSLRSILQKYAHVLAVQSAFTGLSNAVHPIEERLARWILMCDDRVAAGTLALTHDFMSLMLAVRRPSVTTALHVLEGNKLIYAERGLITVRDRAGLEAFAGDAYGKPEREYERLLGPYP